VAYLNGSKALTTGSALVFDGTNLGVGVGVTPDRKLTLLVSPSTAGDDGYKISDGTRASTFARTGATYSYQGVGVNSTLLYSSNTLCLLADGSSVLSFHNGNGETARIDTSGNLLVGTTSYVYSASERIAIRATGTVGGMGIETNTALGIGLNIQGGGASSKFMSFAIGGTETGSITYNGTTTVLNPTSDVRLKENIVDAGSALDKINAVRIRSFNWKSNNYFTDFGVIAQELVEVAPECVRVGSDEINENGELKDAWGAQPYVLVPAMIKAIQEQQALIQTLTDRITALENK
jgi:hypothetical protein